jgi:hypothetical protein
VNPFKIPGENYPYLPAKRAIDLQDRCEPILIENFGWEVFERPRFMVKNLRMIPTTNHSDLFNFDQPGKAVACGHLTFLDYGVAVGENSPPTWHSPDLWVLQERRLKHERAYIAHLAAQGLSIVDLRDASTKGRTAKSQTTKALALRT